MRALFVLLLVVCLAMPAHGNQQLPLVRVARYEPVTDLQVSDTRDSLSFGAYNKLWVFSIWLSDVTAENNDHFHGRLEGSSHSIASWTLMPDYVTGMIVTANDTYWVEAKDPAIPLDLYIYRSSDIWFHPSASLKCGHAGRQEHIRSSVNSIGKRDISSVGILMDQYWASTTYNPSWNTASATLGLLNDVNAVYGSAGLFGFNFDILGVRSNSWTSKAAVSNMLADFSTWSKSAVPTSYNIVAWLVGKDVGGLAWVGSGCGAYGTFYRTSVSGLISTSRLWTVKTIAHELGHNRGATHDFGSQCAPNQATDCQCSVMSFCLPTASTSGGASNYFSQKSVSEITQVCND